MVLYEHSHDIEGFGESVFINHTSNVKYAVTA
jgi:hypothetical protein